MPEEVSIDATNGIIVVRSWGHITPSDMISSRDKIFEIYDETKIDKVLIDGRKQQSFLKAIDTYEYSEEIGKDSRSRKIKYAIVPSKDSIEDLNFLETASQNRGLSVMIHESMESAKSWLKNFA
ncbi:hypothetical protein ACFL2O_06645 [Thermodesulfobacteriota bacterium]